jgi:hypothetical protein
LASQSKVTRILRQSLVELIEGCLRSAIAPQGLGQGGLGITMSRAPLQGRVHKTAGLLILTAAPGRLRLLA